MNPPFDITGHTIRKSFIITLAFLICFEWAVVAQTIGISQQPTDVTTQPGLTATFSVVATSSPPSALSYQWFKNTTPIANATNVSTIRAAYNDGTRDLVVLEAEHYDKNTAGGGQSWTFTTTPPFLLPTGTDTNFSGTGTMVQPNTLAGFSYNPGDRPTGNPQLDYEVYFPAAGNYYVWVRGAGNSDAGGDHDSVNVGLDGAIAFRVNGLFPQTAGYGWGSTPTPGGVFLTVPSAGVHVFNLWQREDRFAVDKVVITQDAGYTPTGLGPAESPLLTGASISSYTTKVLNAGDLGTNQYHVRVSAGVPFVDSATVSLVVTSSFVRSTFYSGVVFNDQPLAYWSFDEAGPTDTAKQQMDVPQGGTTVNDLVPALNATRVGHGAISSGLLLGNTADLDNTSNFNTPTMNLGKASLTGPWAVEFWMQHATNENAQDILFESAGNGNLSIYYGWVQNQLQYYAAGSTANTYAIAETNTTWHHVMWLYYGPLRQANKMDVYVDGVQSVEQGATPFQVALTLQYLVIGDYLTAGSPYSFFGRMDEVAIYDLSRFTTEGQLRARMEAVIHEHELASTINGAGVTVNITQQPVDVSTAVGNTANFTVQATGSGVLAYQWQKNWVDIPGANNTSYTTPATSANDAGASVFRARVSSGSVFVNSQEAILNVTGVSINFSQQPTNVTVSIGGTATFSATAASTPSGQLSYQWYKNATKIIDATNSSYTTAVLGAADVGTNFFQLRVSVGNIFVDSVSAALTVPAPPPLPPTAYSLVVSNDLPLLYWNFDEGGGNALQRMPLPTSPTTANNLVPQYLATRVSHAAIASGLLLGNAADLNGAKDNFTASPLNVGQTLLLGPYAIEFWEQLDGTRGSPSQDYVISLADNGAYAILQQSGSWDWYGGGAAGSDTTTGGCLIPTSNTGWHHQLWVYYGDLRAQNKVDVYCDGILNANVVGTYDRGLPLNNTMSVGDYAAVGSAFGFGGRLDEVAIYDWTAFSDEVALQAYATDMVARHRAAAIPVVLSFARAGNQLTLSWSGVGYTLEKTASLTPAVTWVDAPSGTNNPAIVTISGANTFYRLRKL